MGTQFSLEKLAQLRQQYVESECKRSLVDKDVLDTLRRIRDDEITRASVISNLFGYGPMATGFLLRTYIELQLEEIGLGVVMAEHAQPVTNIHNLHELIDTSEKELTTDAVTMLHSLCMSQTGAVYYPQGHELKVTVTDPFSFILAFRAGPYTTLWKLTPDDHDKYKLVLVNKDHVLKYLMVQWLSGGSSDWIKARDFLLDQAVIAIEKYFSHLNQLFNTAVALDNDADKICHADWIVVVDENRLDFIAAEHFHDCPLNSSDYHVKRYSAAIPYIDDMGIEGAYKLAKDRTEHSSTRHHLGIGLMVYARSWLNQEKKEKLRLLFVRPDMLPKGLYEYPIKTTLVLNLI